MTSAQATTASQAPAGGTRVKAPSAPTNLPPRPSKALRAFGLALGLPLSLLPSAFVGAVATAALRLRAKRSAPADGLRLLFGVGADLYLLEGELAIRYGNGVHTKHRHLRYHDFFVDRIPAGERVLDIGCGIGVVARDIAERADATVVGIDINEKSIEHAKKTHVSDRLEFRVGDVIREPIHGGFDTVVMSNVLEHLPDRAPLLRRIAEQSGAKRFLIRVPLFERDWRVPLRRELGVEWRLDDTHETEYTLESFRQEMADAGFREVHLECRWGEIWSELGVDRTHAAPNEA